VLAAQAECYEDLGRHVAPEWMAQLEHGGARRPSNRSSSYLRQLGVAWPDAHEPGEPPIGRRVGVENPYADAKAMLLGAIAQANGCRAVWTKQLAFTTVFGHRDDLDGIEELFTSLLVQATGALRCAGSKVDGGGRSRTTRYRRSFLVAFAVRIGERLREAVRATVDDATISTGTELVPLLRARSDAADALANATFPEVTTFSPSATDGEGWHAGRRFGDLADLGIAPPLGRSA
jgi:hypothetical protein